MEGSTSVSGEPGGNLIGGQLASLIPTFDPATDELRVYQQKIELVAAAWPKNRIPELITRLILNCKGSAFQKLQLNKAELFTLTDENKVIQKIIELLGGQWGRIGLEDQYEDAEAALFNTQQKADESHDSYLARSDILWSRLLSRRMTLEELQAYIVLRGSLLTSDEKKRVILDCDQHNAGKLSMKRVTEAIRLLGASFFHEITGNRKATKTRVYEAANLATDRDDDEEDPAFMATNDITEDDIVDWLQQEGDEDAALVTEYEEALSEAIQEDATLATAYNSYVDARKRLAEKARYRGFWPTSGQNASATHPSGAKGKGYGHHQQPKGYNKGKQSYMPFGPRPRKTLQDRIMSSTCRICKKRGHWKAECPLRHSNPGGSVGTSQGSGHQAPTTTVVSFENESQMDPMPLEFVQLPIISEKSVDEDAQPPMHALNFASVSVHRKYQRQYQPFFGIGIAGDSVRVNGIKGHAARDRLHQRVARSNGTPPTHEIRELLKARVSPHSHDDHLNTTISTRHQPSQTINTPTTISRSQEAQEHVLFATHGTLGVLDLGASKTVIGSEFLQELIVGLKSIPGIQLGRCPCNITFKFGNQGVLDSHEALVVAVGQLHLRIAIVPGKTPFLLSNTFMRAIHANIDCSNRVLQSPTFCRAVPLHLTSRGLFLIDLCDIIRASESQRSGATPTGVKARADTFVIEEPTENQGLRDQSQVSVQEEQFSCAHPNLGDPHKTNRVTSGFVKQLISQWEGNESCPPKPNTTASKIVSTHSENQFPRSVQESCHPCPSHDRHVESRQSTSSSTDAPGGLPGGCHSLDLAHAEPGTHHVRGQALEQVVRGGLEHRSELGDVHGEPLPLQHEGGTPSIHAVRPSEAGGSGKPSSPTSFANPRGTGSAEPDQPGEGKGQGSKWIPTTSILIDTRRPRFSHGGGRRGVRIGTRDIIPDDYLGRAGECPSSRASSSLGECPAASDPACGHGPPSPGWREPLVSQDNESDPILGMHHVTKHFKDLVIEITKELERCQSTVRAVGKPFHLAEVFASDQSPLTKQVQSQGGSAFRYGYSQGDLATSQGRMNLFRLLLTHRPKHLWYSPTCGPWSSWTQLNSSRSLDHHDYYQDARKDLMYTLALGIVLYRYQLSMGNHFHLEQPQRSLMIHAPELSEMHTHTQACQFDMCNVGNLTDPSTGRFMKKGMIVLTTSNTMFQFLHGKTCNHQHQHQPIEGSIQHKGMTILRTQYTEVYPRKFARSIARIVCTDRWERPVNWHQVSPMLRQQNVSKDYTAPVFVGTTRKKPQFPRSELMDPPTREDLQAKRRRIDGKNPAPISLEHLQEMFQRINRDLPRVGRREITDGTIRGTLTALWPDKSIVSITACRGTDRTMAPPADLLSSNAPYRRSIMLLRDSGDIKYERHWENWSVLAQRQVIRPSHACRIRVTVFAQDIVENTSTQERLPGPSSSQDMTDTPTTANSSEHPPVVNSPGEPSEARTSTPVITRVDQGTRFKALPSWEQSMLIKMHKNLGHPSNERLAQALQTAKYRPEIVQAALELKCVTCAQCNPPKHQRPATLKPNMEFNTKIYMDKVTWTNQQKQTLHFYHLIDAGTNYHIAIASPAGTTEHVMSIIQQHWVSWAGPPEQISVDSASELNSKEFMEYLQKMNIRGHTIPPEAHWHHGKIERHGSFLQHMLDRVDREFPIKSYSDLQATLNQCIHAKNTLSIRAGYAPEIIVFGKHSRIPGSVLSDESLPSHTQVLQENPEETMHNPMSLRRMLALRECARKAFHEADNSDALRRAALRRSCPSRGVFHRDQWVMIWKTTEGDPQWIGPQRVILQDGNHSVWTTQSGKLFQRAPEHVRLAYPEEGSPEEISMEQYTNMSRQIQRLQSIPEDITPPETTNEPIPVEVDSQPHTSDISPTPSQDNLPQPDPSQDSIPQPEPEESHQTNSETEQTSENAETLQLLSQEIETALITSTSEHLAWRCEVSVNLDKPLHEHQPSQCEALTMLATASKRQRSEVRLTDLNPSEREEFEAAKQTEISNWIQTGTIAKIFRNEIAPEQVLRCRWILTWKPIDGAEQAGFDQPTTEIRSHKAKARLVVLGYLDPDIENIPRDSPTLNKTSRMLILQVISSLGFSLQSFDIKAAFLQGEPQAGRTMAVEPVPEMRRALQMGPNEVAHLRKGAYGLVDAPYLWYCSLVRELTSLGFETSPFCPCTFVLREPPNSPNAGQVAGILGIHVDDGIGGGNEYFQKQIDALERKYPFGSKKAGTFTFTGIEMSQQGDNSIVLNQAAYVNKIPSIAIDANRKTQPDEPVTEEERLALRGLVGSLQYAAVNTRPDLASKLSALQSSINHAKVENLQEGNRLLHEAKRHSDVQVVIKPIPVSSFRFMAFSDASFASANKPSSQMGTFIVGTHEKILHNHQCVISPLSWGSRKIQRVVTSTLSAESTALSSTLDQLAWLRLYWGWIHNANTKWRNPEVGLKELQPAITVPTLVDHCDLAITDCKSLFDLVTRTAPPSCAEFRVQLVARAIKEALTEGIRLRWVHSGAQLADSLTKAMDARFLRETLKLGFYKLSDEDAVLKERAKTKDRIQWLKATQKEK